MKIGIIGCGSWGSAIANLLTHIGHEVHMYTQSKEQYERIRSIGDNPGYLEDFKFDPSIEIHLSIEETIDGADGEPIQVSNTRWRDPADALPWDAWEAEYDDTYMEGWNDGYEEAINDMLTDGIDDATPARRRH